jgi:putative oxidoreductase
LTVFVQLCAATQLQAWGITLLRVGTGIVFLEAAGQKLEVQNLFLQHFIQLPGPIFIVGSLVELFCGAALVVGLLTRWIFIPLALLMLADILVIHLPSGFFAADEKFEHAFLRLVASAALALARPGKMALDNMIAIRRGPKQA